MWHRRSRGESPFLLTCLKALILPLQIHFRIKLESNSCQCGACVPLFLRFLVFRQLSPSFTSSFLSASRHLLDNHQRPSARYTPTGRYACILILAATMASIPVDDHGTRLSYIDSGVPAGTPDGKPYTVLFAIHGTSFTNGKPSFSSSCYSLG